MAFSSQNPLLIQFRAKYTLASGRVTYWQSAVSRKPFQSLTCVGHVTALDKRILSLDKVEEKKWQAGYSLGERPVYPTFCHLGARLGLLAWIWGG